MKKNVLPLPPAPGWGCSTAGIGCVGSGLSFGIWRCGCWDPVPDPRAAGPAPTEQVYSQGPAVGAPLCLLRCHGEPVVMACSRPASTTLTMLFVFLFALQPPKSMNLHWHTRSETTACTRTQARVAEAGQGQMPQSLCCGHSPCGTRPENYIQDDTWPCLTATALAAANSPLGLTWAPFAPFCLETAAA